MSFNAPKIFRLPALTRPLDLFPTIRRAVFVFLEAPGDSLSPWSWFAPATDSSLKIGCATLCLWNHTYFEVHFPICFYVTSTAPLSFGVLFRLPSFSFFCVVCLLWGEEEEVEVTYNHVGTNRTTSMRQAFPETTVAATTASFFFLLLIADRVYYIHFILPSPVVLRLFLIFIAYLVIHPLLEYKPYTRRSPFVYGWARLPDLKGVPCFAAGRREPLRRERHAKSDRGFFCFPRRAGKQCFGNVREPPSKINRIIQLP